MKAFAPLLFIVLSACATAETQRFGSEPDYGVTNAEPASYGTDNFMVQKLMPIRAPSSSVNFYNKQCQESGHSSFVSKTSYYCDYR
jgi:hypothetical protein